MRQSLESADPTTSLSESSKTVRVAVQSSLPQAAVVYSVPDSAAASSHCRLISNSDSSALTLTTNALAKALTKPSVKPRPGRLVICSRCQHAIGLVDRSVQTVSPDNIRQVESPPANGFTSSSSYKLPSSVHKSQQLAVETRI